MSAFVLSCVKNEHSFKIVYGIFVVFNLVCFMCVSFVLKSTNID